MTFIPGLQPPEPAQRGWWFVFSGADLLVQVAPNGATNLVPQLTHPDELGLVPDGTHYLGTLDEQPCTAAAFSQRPAALPDGYALVNLRELYGALPEPLFSLATRATHLANWELSHRFCGRCGQPVQTKADERAKWCPACGLLTFPQIAPAVIVAVRRDDRILLAHSPRFPAGLYSVLAGFVEPGETLEACVHREIHEEVGLTVTNLRYFGSQPWPYPMSLMLGFTADHAGGEITVDGAEVLEAGWFRADQFPTLPMKLSIARRLIDDFVRRVSAA